MKTRMFLKSASTLRRLRAVDEEGSSLVEMALSCLILIPVLFGIIQMSFALYCYHYAADAAREATRFAIVRGVNCGKFLSNSAYCSPTDGSSTGATANDIAQYVKTLGYPYSATATHQRSMVHQERIRAGRRAQAPRTMLLATR